VRPAESACAARRRHRRLLGGEFFHTRTNGPCSLAMRARGGHAGIQVRRSSSWRAFSARSSLASRACSVRASLSSCPFTGSLRRDRVHIRSRRRIDCCYARHKRNSRFASPGATWFDWLYEVEPVILIVSMRRRKEHIGFAFRHYSPIWRSSTSSVIGKSVSIRVRSPIGSTQARYEDGPVARTNSRWAEEA